MDSMSSDQSLEEKDMKMVPYTKLMAKIDKIEQSFEYKYFQLHSLRQKIYIICGISTWLPIAFSIVSVPLLFCTHLHFLESFIGISLFFFGIQLAFLSTISIIASCTLYPKLLRFNILCYLPSSLEFFTIGISMLCVSISIIQNDTNLKISAVLVILHLCVVFLVRTVLIKTERYRLKLFMIFFFMAATTFYKLSRIYSNWDDPMGYNDMTHQFYVKVLLCCSALCYSCMWLCISFNFYKLGQKHKKTRNSRLPWFSNFYLRFVAAVTMPPFLITQKKLNVNSSVDYVQEDCEKHNFLPYKSIEANNHFLFIDYKGRIYLKRRETSSTEAQSVCVSPHVHENDNHYTMFKMNQSLSFFSFKFLPKLSCKDYYHHFYSIIENSFFLSACGSSLISFLTLLICIDIWLPKIFSFRFFHRYFTYSLINNHSMSNTIKSPLTLISLTDFPLSATQSVFFLCWVISYAIGIILLTNSGVMIFGQWIDFILFGSLSMLNRNQLFDLKYPDHSLLLDSYKMKSDQIQQVNKFFVKVLLEPSQLYCTPYFSDCHKQLRSANV